MVKEEAMECVGSLLVPAHNVQELSDIAAPPARVNVQQRVTAVGTLLVPSKDLTVEDTATTMRTSNSSSSADGPSQLSSLQRRITDKLMGPPPPDSDADTWAD